MSDKVQYWIVLVINMFACCDEFVWMIILSVIFYNRLASVLLSTTRMNSLFLVEKFLVFLPTYTMYDVAGWCRSCGRVFRFMFLRIQFNVVSWSALKQIFRIIASCCDETKRFAQYEEQWLRKVYLSSLHVCFLALRF